MTGGTRRGPGPRRAAGAGPSSGPGQQPGTAQRGAPGPDPAAPKTTTPVPAVGTPVRDTLLDRVGVVMDKEGPYLQLRPLAGGREWDADPARVRLLTQAELLSARVAEANARSRVDLGLGDEPRIQTDRTDDGSR